MVQSANPSSVPQNPGMIEAPFFIGVMISCVLFGITCAQTMYYFRTYAKDHRVIRILVGTLFSLEFFHQVLLGEAAHFFYVAAKLPEKTQGVFYVRKSFSVAFGIQVIITSLVQTFYGWRLWLIGRNHRSRSFVVGLILLLSILQFGGGLGVVGFVIARPALSDLHKPGPQILFSAELCIAMLADILITGSLVYHLKKSRSGYGPTGTIIDRLIHMTLNIGLLTSAIAVATFVTYHTMRQSTTFSLFTELISKIYVNSLLATLNSRRDTNLSNYESERNSTQVFTSIVPEESYALSNAAHLNRHMPP